MPELARRSLKALAVATAIACPVFLLGLYVDSLTVRLPAKPWPHLLLIAWILSAGLSAYSVRIATGIALCMVADVLLEFRQTHFIHGMAVFLLVQLTFASAFLLQCRELRSAAVLPFVVWLSVAFGAISPGLGPMFAPVVAYMAAIGLMMWRAAAWAAASAGRASRFALVGAVTFGISDSMIALDRFRATIPGARYGIILTYWGALALIAASTVKDDGEAMN